MLSSVFPLATRLNMTTREPSSSRGKGGSGFKGKMKVGLICAVGGGQVIRGNSVVMLEVCFFGSWLG